MDIVRAARRLLSSHRDVGDPLGDFVRDQAPSLFMFNPAWIVLMKTGAKRVGLAGCVPVDAAERIEEQARGLLGRGLAFARRRVQRRDEPGVVDIFFGFDEADVVEVADLSEMKMPPRSEPEAKERVAAATRRLGELLGYPACCVDAFIGRSEFEQLNLGWSYAGLRSSAGVVDSRLNPVWGLKLYHLPCTLDCPRTLAQVEAAASALAEAYGRRFMQLSVSMSRLPVVLDLDRFPQHVVVRPESDWNGGVLAYREAHAFTSPGSPLQMLSGGDRLEVGPGTVRVAGGSRVLGTLGPATYVWTAETAFHRDFWLAEVARRVQAHPCPPTTTPTVP